MYIPVIIDIALNDTSRATDTFGLSIESVYEFLSSSGGGREYR